MKLSVLRLFCATVLVFGAHAANAIVVSDPIGDYVSGFAGSKKGDLDAVGAFVTYNPATDTFLFGGIMDANIGTSTNGTSPSGLYVWGVNRGAGQPLFAANGVPGVVFDSVVVFRADGTGSVSSILPTSSTTALPSGTVQHVGSMIFGEVSGSFLPSTGFAKTDYTWNLWPRDGTLPAGFGQIADFAPDNSNSHVIVLQAVPEPASAGMLGIGLGALLLVAARRLRA